MAASVHLVQDGQLIPRVVLDDHQRRLGVPAVADASGRLFIPALRPGLYRLYSSEATSATQILQGTNRGYMDSIGLAGFDTTNVELVVESERPQGQFFVRGRARRPH